MSAHYYGYATVQCYHDCRQTGCPGHRIRLAEKHGGVFIEYLDERGQTLSRTDLPIDPNLLRAIQRILNDDARQAEVR